MTVTYATNARNASADAIVDLLDVGGAGSIQVATSAFALILATIALSATAFGAAASGVAALNGTPLSDTSADASGTAAVWRARNNAGTTVLDGPAATSGGGDINLSTAAQRAALDAVTALLNGGDVQFATSNAFSTILATLPLNSTAFAAATGAAPATAAMGTSPLVQNTIAISGTATDFRMRTSGGVEVLRGTVSTSGADINLNANVLTASQQLTLNFFTLSQAATTAASDGAMVLASLTITVAEAVTITSGSYTHPAS